nr:hypothetical protein [Tanacetum cinerariifolium]
MNGWLIKDNEEEEEVEEEDEEEIEAEEDEDMEVEDNEDENDAEIIQPYEEVNPLNRPPPIPETAKQEFMNALFSHSTLQPLPPIRQFAGTFYVGEGSSATVFNFALCKVYAPRVMINDLSSLYTRVNTLTNQMWDSYRVESSSSKRLEKNDMWIDSFDDDLTALDSTLREQIQEIKKLMAEDNAVHADAASDRGGKGVNTTVVVKDVGEEKAEEERDLEEKPKEEEEPDNEEEEEAKEEDEEEIEAEEDEDMGVEDNEDENDAEIIQPYEEVNPLNRPPPIPETAKQEFMNALFSHSTLQPLPPIRQFAGTFYVGEGSSATVFNFALCKVYAPRVMINYLSSLYTRVKTLTNQMWDSYRVESSSSKRLEKNDMWIDSFDDDLTALDSILREQIQEIKKLMAEDNAVRADAASDRGGEGVNTTAVVKDVGEEKGDKGNDVAAAKDLQPLEFCGSLQPCLQQEGPKPTLNLL